MLEVVTPEQALETIRLKFGERRTPEETVPLDAALGRVLSRGVQAEEYVPGFDRSTVDGYAVRARDTFGCSESLPALLNLGGSVRMGQEADFDLPRDTAVQVPTGGALPRGADAVVMVEYSEEYGDGTVGLMKPAAPGQNVIFRGDDVKPGQELFPAGRRLAPHDLGALAALGVSAVPVRARPSVGILSTGDELVEADQVPAPGEIRDVNSHMLSAMAAAWGGIPRSEGILRDQEDLLEETVRRMAADHDLVLISGGSSVGEKDATCRVLEKLGTVYFHGIAMKPGKPTILGSVNGTPVMGLPGHPAAAFYVSRLFVRPLLCGLMGNVPAEVTETAVLTTAIPANHGRAQYTAVRLERGSDGLVARPVPNKSGLITTLAASDGWVCVPRDCEGLAAGSRVEVVLYGAE